MVPVLMSCACAAGWGAPDWRTSQTGQSPQTISNDTSADFYADPVNGNDTSGTGSFTQPFASIARTQQAVRALIKTNPNRPITVMLRGGTFYLPLSPTSPGTLSFLSTGSQNDSGTVNMPITWQNYPGETPVISGGEPVGAGGLNLTWKNVAGNWWQVQLPAGTQDFEYLYYNGDRRLRARPASSTGVGYYMSGGVCRSTVTGQTVAAPLCSVGTFFRVATMILPTGNNANCPIVTDTKNGKGPKCIDRFGYDPNDAPAITAWSNLNPAPTSSQSCPMSPNPAYPVGDIEITLFDAWTVDVMRVSCVDIAHSIIFFTGSTNSNPAEWGYFGPNVGHRYMVDNVKDAFDAARTSGETGIWFLDRSTTPNWTLNYLANANETNPNNDTVVIAQLQSVAGTGTATEPLGGSLMEAVNLNYVTFSGITFEVDNYLPPAEGFNNDESEDDVLPEAIDCESCQHVTFDGVTVRNTATTGILIASTSNTTGTPAAYNLIQNSALYDLGDAGVRVGHKFSGNDKAASVPQFLTIQDTLIEGYARVFPMARGIAQSSGHDMLYSHNDINGGYHAGISVCYNGCGNHKANGFNIVSQYNHIWNSMGGITSDGGTLYYNIGESGGNATNSNGVTGDKIFNNLVHDTTDSSIIDAGVPASGYGGHGIYLDAQTGGVDVENNVVYRVSASGAWMTQGPAPGVPANTFANNIFAYGRNTMFTESNSWPQGCSTSPPPSLRVSFTNNIFHFDLDDSSQFYVTNGCEYTCGLSYNNYQNFQGNLYWRTDGGFSAYTKGFHVSKNSYSDATTCSGSGSESKDWTFFPFSTWQSSQQPVSWGPPGGLNEDLAGTVLVDPGFGSLGQPTDFWLNSDPVPGLLDHTKTNDTILNAGRDPAGSYPPAPAVVPDTFPTYAFTTVPVTVNTSPSGLQFTVDGGPLYTAPQVANLPQGGKHTLAVAGTQTALGGQYAFQKWSDGPTGASRVISVGTSASTYTANFTATSYQLAIAASPVVGGAVTPASGSFYTPGTVVSISASPAPGYSFTNWTGNVAAPTNLNTTITMSQAQTVTANFAAQNVTVTKIGTYNAGQWRLDVNGNGAWDGDPPDVAGSFGAGLPGAIYVTGDWNGDGHKKMGVFYQGFWYLDFIGNGVWDGGVVDKQYNFGWADPNVIPVVGDWNGDGRTKIGVYYQGFWYLDYDGNGIWDGGINDKAYNIGWPAPGVTPIVGDWSGTGTSKVGIYYYGFWYLDYDGNGVFNPTKDKSYNFGWQATGVTPIMGDWNGDGRIKIGIYYNGFWYLDYDGNGVWDGGVNDKMYNLGWADPAVTPVMGDWTGTGTTKIGIFYDGYWYLDFKGNGVWDGGIVDKAYAWGQAGDTPVVGAW
jgi:hypothetical protein